MSQCWRICLQTQEMQVQSLGWEDPLEKGMATHSSILAWKIPRTEEPGGLQSMVLQRVRHDWATNTHLLRASQVAPVVKNLPASSGRHKRHRFDSWVRKIPWRRAWQSTPVFLFGKSHGQRRAAVHSVTKSRTQGWSDLVSFRELRSHMPDRAPKK